MKITPKEVQEIAAAHRRAGSAARACRSDGEGARAIVPDLVVEKVDEDGDDYVVYLNDANLPRLRVSQAYEARQGLGHGQRRRGPVHRREEALRRVDHQDHRAAPAHHDQGHGGHRAPSRRSSSSRAPSRCRPLTLQQVATAIGMHESTVSRVTRQKYVQTPRGVFPLKYFFRAGLDTDEGDEVAAKAVKIMIQEIVEGENTARPLSDKKIVDMLQERGLKIARRTVAKYREQMGILNARMRKQF